jgi:hypothetical protein
MVESHVAYSDAGDGIPIPRAWPTHRQKPFAFKAYALEAASAGFDMLLWADACIVPIAASLQPIWDYATANGVWISRNGWNNYQWTAESAYIDLFGPRWPSQVQANRRIEHVVAGAFALSLTHAKGKAFLAEYYRLASQTNAFIGPLWNSNHEGFAGRPGAAPCGPPDVLGHRHDQTAASVIAWRLGVPLTSPPQYFSYKGGETADTILIADGSY